MGVGGGGVEADFKCLIFISMHATFDHAICMTLVLYREGRRVRMTNKEGREKWRAKNLEVRKGKLALESGENNEKSTCNQERGATALGNCTVSKVSDAC